MNGRSIDRRRLHKWRNNHYRKQILSVLKKSNCCGRDLRKDKLQKVEGFPGGSDSKESACNAGDLSSIPGLGRSPGGGHGNPLQCSCLEKPHGQRSLGGYSSWGCKESSTNVFLSLCNACCYVLTFFSLLLEEFIYEI